MCRHFDLNFRRGLERLFPMGVNTKDLNRGGANNKWNGPIILSPSPAFNSR